jgi:hypothetical protein
MAKPSWLGERPRACIMFALTPNSASCECVFALLRVMYDHTQKRARSQIKCKRQAALILRYNLQ